MKRPSRSTLAQLPKDAAAYYAESTAEGLFAYELAGKDGLGRSVFQKYLDGEEYGAPRALLTFAEFKASVNRAALLVGSSVNLGVSRWTVPYN